MFYFCKQEMALDPTMEPPPFNTMEFISSATNFYSAINDLVMFLDVNKLDAADKLQMEVWMRVVRNIDLELRNMQSAPFNPQQ